LTICAFVVSVLPQIIPFSAGDEVINAGEVVSFTCTILKGDSPITINWFFNGTEIESSEEVVISKISKKVSALTIESARAHHVGEYTCVAKNAAGANNYTTILIINGSHPTISDLEIVFYLLTSPPVLSFLFIRCFRFILIHF
jgi:Immunoglobulin I-set domain